MLLLLAIVQTEDAPALTKRLIEQGLRLTQINTSGGLILSGSAALLLGIEEEQYSEVINAIQATCKSRTEYASMVAFAEPAFTLLNPVEVVVGGAVVFGVPVERFLRLQSGGAPAAIDVHYAVTSASQALRIGERPVEVTKNEGTAMKLIIAIVHAEEVDAVIGTLLTAEYRLTRINTTGGFLRRGNATLLIGVEPEKVDEVIALIQSSCRARSKPAPVEKGIPMYAATLFVLDASHFMHI